MDRIHIKFSPRQLETIGLLLEGCSNKEIATIMQISEETVKKNISNICNLTSMDSRLQVVLFCIRNKIYQIPDTTPGSRRYMKFAMTPEQFAKLRSIAPTDSSVSVVKIDANSGTITNSDVQLAYSYDGTGSLDIEIVKKIGFFARHSSDDVIFQHINKMLSTVT